MDNGEFPEWSKGADCKSVGSSFVGPNPSLPSKKASVASRCFFFDFAYVFIDRQMSFFNVAYLFFFILIL